MEINCNDVFMRHIFWGTWNAKVIAQSPALTTANKKKLQDCWCREGGGGVGGVGGGGGGWGVGWGGGGGGGDGGGGGGGGGANAEKKISLSQFQCH